MKTIDNDQLLSLSNYYLTDIDIVIIDVNCVSRKQNQTCWKFSLFPRADYNIFILYLISFRFILFGRFPIVCDTVKINIVKSSETCYLSPAMIMMMLMEYFANTCESLLTVITTNRPTVFSHIYDSHFNHN